MNIRSIGHDELELFSRIGQPPGTIGSPFYEKTAQLWHLGESKPAWCFIAEENGVPIGRVGYWAFVSTPQDIKIFGLSVPWERPEYCKIARELIERTLDLMKRAGAETLENHIHSDKMPDLNKKLEVFEAAGIPLVQEKVRYVLRKDKNTFIPVPQRLYFKSLDEAGVDLYLEIIGKVSLGTLDRQDQLTMQESGLQGVIQDYYTTLRDMHYYPMWWKLGYLPGENEEEPIGLVIPQLLDETMGVINYIGVIPEFRGRGLVKDLLAEGTQILLEDAAEKVVGDTDSENIPMQKAFERTGYEQRGRIWVYKMKI